MTAKAKHAYGVSKGDAPPCGRPEGVSPGDTIEFEARAAREGYLFVAAALGPRRPSQ